MGTFTAYQGLNVKTGLQLAFSQFNSHSSFPLETSTELRASNLTGSVVIDVKGQGFTYDPLGVPIAGQINSVEVDLNYSPAFTFTLLHVSLKKVSDDILSHQFSDALAALFAGNDLIKGSAFNDVLIGGGGHNKFDFTAMTFGHDKVVDFTAADKLEFSATVFDSFKEVKHASHLVGAAHHQHVEIVVDANNTVDLMSVHNVDTLKGHLIFV